MNAAQFQQMHQGQISSHTSFTSQTPASANYTSPPSNHEYNPAAPHVGIHQAPSNEATAASSIDDLIANASKQADANAAAASTTKSSTPQPAQVPLVPKDEPTEDKTAKKEKDKEKTTKATRLVYSDNEISPEEKMAAMSKYAFTPLQKTIQV